MQKNIGSVAAITDAARAMLEKLAATLDEVFPSVVVAPRGGGIGEPSDSYEMGAGKPDFVRADDEGWV